MGRHKENRIYSMFEYNEQTKKSKCLMEGCNQFIKGNHGANLLRHFYSQHRLKYDEIKKTNLEAKEKMPDEPSTKVKSILDCCTRLVSVHGRPFNMIEDEAFKDLLNHTSMTKNEQLTINIKNVKDNISEMAYNIRQQISKDLKNCLLALKVDVASLKLRRFLGINVQYISNGKIVLRNLSVMELHDRNTAEYLKENIALILSRFSIELKQVLTITTDNGANMLRMISLMDESVVAESAMTDSSIDSFIEIETSDDSIDDSFDDTIQDFELQIEEEKKITSIRCAAHCLQLAVKDACQDLDEFLDQCRLIVRSLRTPNMSLRLKQQHLPQAVLDMPVRWDSTAQMLQRLEMLKSFCVENLNVSEETWTCLDKYLQILQPCKDLSKVLQKEQITFGDFYISWMRCRHRISLIEDPFARRLESCMINRQRNLFENNYFLAAIYLDPRVNSILTQEQKTRSRALLVDIYKRIVHLNEIHERENASHRPGTSSDVLSDLTNFDDYLRQQFDSSTNRQEPDANSFETEVTYKLVDFLREPILPSDSNILSYWEKKQVTDPYLYNLAKVVLATPPTSVSVERLFSSLKFVVNNLRMRLTDSVIEDLMIVRNNYLYSQ